MRRTFLLIATGLLAAAFLAGCGGSESAEAEEEEVTPAQAVAEIGTIRRMLDEAVEKYRAGEAEEAEEIVGDAYLEHFELVEHPLEERDHELMEELEVLISTTIRNEIKDGAPPEEVEQLVAEAKEGLAEAETLLKEGA